MPGLPFVSLSEAENLEDRAMIEQQNTTVQRNLTEMRTGSRPWVEIASAPAQSAPDLGNPLDILAADGRTALDTALGQFKSQREALQKSIDPDINLAYQKAMLDVETVNNSDLDIAVKQQRVKNLETNYRKKKLDIQAKIRGDIEMLDAEEQKTKSTAAMNMVLRQREVQLYQGLADSGKLDPYEAMSLQYKAVGRNVPVGFLRPKKSPQEAARKQYIQTKQILDDTVGELLNYRRDPKTGEWQILDDKGQVAGVVPKEQQAYVDDLEARRQVLAPQAETLFWQWTGGRRPNLSVSAAKTLSPMGQGLVSRLLMGLDARVARGELGGTWYPKANAPATTGKPLTEAQALVFLQQTGGNKDQARELARNQGYEIR